MNNKDIIISIAADSRKFLQGIQEALETAERQAKKSSMTDILENKIKHLNKTVQSSHQQINSLLASVLNSDMDGGIFDTMTDKIKSSQKTIRNLVQKIPALSLDVDFSNEDAFNTFLNQITKGINKFTSQSSSLQDTVNTICTSFRSVSDDPGIKDSAAVLTQMGAKIDSLFNSGKKIDNRTKVYKNAIGEILNLYDEYTSSGGSIPLDTLANTVSGSGISDSASEALNNAHKRRQSPKANTEELERTTRNAAEAANHLANADRQTAESADQASDSLHSQSDALQETATQSEKTEGSVKRLANVTELLAYGWKFVTESILGFTSLKTIIDNLKKLASITISLNDSLTQMALSSNNGISSLKEFQKESFIIGNSIGLTALDVQKSASSFLDLGYSLLDTSKLVQSANLYARIEDIGIDQATKQIVSSAKAWGNQFADEITASEAIVDRYSYIGKTYAVNSADLSSAVIKSASALQAGGNDFSEALGMVTTGLQFQDADTTANALQVLSLRLRDNKAELLQMGAGLDGMAASTSELRARILELSNVDIFKDDGSYKSTSEILREIGSQYNTLSASAKKPLLELIAGKGNESSVESLLENYKTLSEVTLSVGSSDGTAQEQNEIYLDSITGKITLFQNQLQQLATVTLNDNFLKDLVEAGTKLLNLLTGIIDKVGLFPTLMTTIGGSLSLKNIGRVI